MRYRIHSVRFTNLDVVFSNLSVQWCQDLSKALSELYRVTKPGELWCLPHLQSILAELSSAWHSLDGYSHVNSLSVQQIQK
ncbi:methyltransferase domain-containing protein [Providencia huaxiensis]|uniref:methyltransferase domain-containing protein n=1 Tax=Providencia huaxiensis TaxID=2027290 RepID=UPI0034DD0ABD